MVEKVSVETEHGWTKNSRVSLGFVLKAVGGNVCLMEKIDRTRGRDCKGCCGFQVVRRWSVCLPQQLQGSVSWQSHVLYVALRGRLTVLQLSLGVQCYQQSSVERLFLSAHSAPLVSHATTSSFPCVCVSISLHLVIRPIQTDQIQVSCSSVALS